MLDGFIHVEGEGEASGRFGELESVLLGIDLVALWAQGAEGK